MAFKTRRQGRYKFLRENGFLPFEARTLSKVPMNVPYMNNLIKERRKEAARASRSGMTSKQWETLIKTKYIMNEWKKGRRSDPWQMLRHYEDIYKQNNPAYDSPWAKRQRSWRDFIRKTENTISMQQGRQDTFFN